MKNAFIAFIALTSFIFCAGIAQAQTSRIYFTGYLGLNTFKDNNFTESTTARRGDMEFNNALSFAGALGLRLNQKWRVEGELSYRNTDLDRVDFTDAAGGTSRLSGNITSWLYMLNLYYDIDFKWKNIQPFLTTGLGLVAHDAQIDAVPGLLPAATDNSIGFAWQVGGGLRYRVKPNLAFSSNYRYLGTSNMNVDGYVVDYGSHEFRLGMEYDLPMDWF